ncbi:hypothetical protein JB92DRAFT_3122580 [Gautieria morchelliformis]|nr:hypothetical protein JB92DRAFT_3122580 [Gautieria morchelliformis]
MASVPSKKTLPLHASTTNQEGRNLRSSSQSTIGNVNETEKVWKALPITPEVAHNYLLAKRLLPKHQIITYHALGTALLHLAEVQASIPKTMEEGIRVISALLTDLAERTTISEIATSIKERLSGANDILTPAIHQIEKSTQAIKTSLTDDDIPHLCEEWMEKITNLVSGIPLELPPLREINHEINLIDPNKHMRYHLPSSPNTSARNCP